MTKYASPLHRSMGVSMIESEPTNLNARLRKWERAIEAVAALPDFSEVTKFLAKLERERDRIRRMYGTNAPSATHRKGN